MANRDRRRRRPEPADGPRRGCPRRLFGVRRESDTETAQLDEDAARALAERFAPTLYFDSREPWFPTDPRPYASERDGQTVITGFDALEGYHERANDRGNADRQLEAVRDRLERAEN